MSEARKLVVPAIAGETGRVTWTKHEGDAVARGDVVVLVDLQFLKVPIKSPCAGKLGKALVQEGSDVGGGITVGLIQPIPEGAREADAIGWVTMECTFRCRACGFDVPLDSLDMDGAVVCVRCGLEQAFDKRAWHDAFDLAHSVADGTTIVRKRAVEGPNQLRVTALPHAPLCNVCQGPIEPKLESGRATVDCKACGTSVVYVVPEAATRMTKGALRAVLADEHRDTVAVKVADTPGAVAIQCPSCSAALDADAKTKFVECKFCKTKSRIPERVWFRLKGGDPKPTPMWLAFAGDSHAKRDAERQKEKDEHEALIERIREHKRAAADAERLARKEALRRAEIAQTHEKESQRAAEAQAEAEERRREAEREQRSQKRWGAYTVVLIIAGCILALSLPFLKC